MGVTTGIGWTDHTLNFWLGCQRVSPGCERCYAEARVVTRMKLPVWGPPSTTERHRTKTAWKDALRWNAAAQREGVRRRAFVSSLSDVFEDHPQLPPWRAEALALLERCTSLDVQLLTKRPQNIRAMVPPHWLTSWPTHIWVGTTVEDQRRAEERIPHLLRVPARVRFLSCEPLLEEIRLTLRAGCHSDDDGECDWKHCPQLRDGEPRRSGRHCPLDFLGYPGLDEESDRPRISWVIVGGESGSDARPFAVEWARSIVGQCRKARVPVFVKQLGDRPTTRLERNEEWPTHDPSGKCGAQFSGDGFGTYYARGLSHHGADPSEWPADLRRQEFPGGDRG